MKHYLSMGFGVNFCMFQKRSQWRALRRVHPDLFCAVQKLENETIAERLRFGTKPFTLLGNGKKVGDMINDRQAVLPGMESLEYPPCQCGL